MAKTYGKKPSFGDGDPVFIVYRDNVRGSFEAICMGTGFHTIEEVERHARAKDLIPKSATEVLVTVPDGELELP